jgi:thymidylate synthase (FAD)
MAIEVRLLDHTGDPVRSLYMAYRTCYSALTPLQVAKRIEDERITSETMLEFVQERLKTGHVSPLEQVWFEFALAGVSRAFSHQFVRHRVGISFEQQSQRYVVYKGGSFPYVVPDTVAAKGFAERYARTMEEIGAFYAEMVEAGVHGEDARFVLPNATTTNFKITINFASLLHMADLRLCTRAQWEFRRVVSLMRAEVFRRFPDLGRQLQPKCGERRMGYCDESLEAWRACPIGRKRPHKSSLFAIFDAHQRGVRLDAPPEGASAEDLDDGDFRTIETFSEPIS